MACYKEILALSLLSLCVLYNYCIEGRFVEIEGGKTETKVYKNTQEGRSIDAHHSITTTNLLSGLINVKSSDYYIHHAGWCTLSSKFHGTRARISVWGIPDVHPNSESLVLIGVWNENGPGYAMIAGFHVYPRLYYGSTDLRLFTAWIKGYNSAKACYSTNCGGFVLSHVYGAPVPGGKVEQLSTYNGEDHFVTLSIKKDEKTQDWSLYRDDNNDPILIGWWPKTLFNNTFDYATKIVWFGGVLYPKNKASPPMGSGHVGCAGARKAAYISHIKLFDQSGKTTFPDLSTVKELTDRMDCFSTDGFTYSHVDAYHFYYGGPPGCKS